MRAWLHQRDGERSTYALTLEQLQQLWACSDRTARRHLKAFQANGYLQYQPGRGRGVVSTVRFARSLHEELQRIIPPLVEASDADRLSRLIRLPFPRAWVLTEEVRAIFGLTQAAPGVDRLRTVLTRALGSLDPLLASNTTEAHLLQQVLDPLLKLNPDTGDVMPHLAHHWQESLDGLSWTFHLRKGVAFHHGRILDAADVQCSLERTRLGAAWLLPDLKATEVLGPFMVRLHLNRPDAFLPHRLCDTAALIIPRDIAFDPDRLIGTGCFRFAKLGGGIRLSAFDAHFDGRPLIDEVEFWRVPAETEPTGFQVQGEPEGDLPHWQAEVGVQFLIWNAHRPSAQDARLRQAVAELYDVQRYWREIGRDDPLVLAASLYPRRTAQKTLAIRDEDRAAMLLTGRAEGPSLVLYTLNWPGPQAEANWLAGRCRSYGLKVEVRGLDLNDMVPPTDADMILLGEVAGADEHLAFLTALQHPELLFRQCLPVALLQLIDRHLEEFRTARTFGQREAILDAVEELLLQDDWLVLTYHRVKRRVLHPLIRDVSPDAYGRIDLKRLWVDRAPSR
ncbi:ABC transporter substrate-binding protein (plasmid) [Deinococcus radiomollis]|uniref:ABC transporter substrate-binding protein n=1 Tax=Deinococcus radiomollis TaxID=468916 RepID=UPI0038921AFA